MSPDHAVWLTSMTSFVHCSAVTVHTLLPHAAFTLLNLQLCSTEDDQFPLVSTL